MKKIIRNLLVFGVVIIFLILLSRNETVRVFFNDDILNVCERIDGFENESRTNSVINQPEKTNIYQGIYEIEFCEIKGYNDFEYLVKLKDAKNKKIYKRAIGDFPEIRVSWTPVYVYTGMGDGSVCFKLPPNNDPNKKKIDELFKDKIKEYGEAEIDCM